MDPRYSYSKPRAVISELVQRFLVVHEYEVFVDSAIRPLLNQMVVEILDDWNMEIVLDQLAEEVSCRPENDKESLKIFDLGA